MKPYIYFQDERGKIKVFLTEFEMKIISRFVIPNKDKRKGLKLYTQDTFRQKININGLVDKVEISTKRWWQFYK